MELRPAFYVVMACAFGACTDNTDDEPSYCTQEQASCVCKPTMKLDLLSVEPTPGGGSLCNNATFEWMVNTMLIEISNLNKRVADLQNAAEVQQEHVHELELTKQKLQSVVVEKEEHIEHLKKSNRELKVHLEEAQRQATQGNVEELQDKISELERTKKRLEFENLQLKERNDLVNEELDQLKSLNVKKPRDCTDIQADGYRSSGVFTVHPQGWQTDEDGVEVFCDLHTDGGGWTVIQRRQDGTQKFDKDWDSYKHGFGKVAREFWIGNELLHHLTEVQGEYELRVDMMDMSGASAHAQYARFSISDEHSQYKLRVDGFSGSIGDSLSHHDNAPFSTRDVDNDQSRSGHCSQLYGNGGWWYVRCYDSNLNGQYGKSDNTGLIWFHWRDMYKHLRHVEMKIRPANFKSRQK